MNWELIKSLTTVIADLAVIAGVVVAVIQLRRLRIDNELQKESIIIDHDRRRKQATIEYYNYIIKESWPLVDRINAQFGKNPVAIDLVDSNDELKKNIRNYLSLMERFSAGIHTNVFDLRLYGLIAGTATIRMHNKLSAYIEDTRNRTFQTAYVEFDKLVADLKILKNSREEDNVRDESKVIEPVIR